MIDRDEVRRRFRYYPPTPERANRHIVVRQELRAVAEQLASMLPDGREKSIVVTKLEEAMFWANAAIAREAAESGGQ